MTDKVREGWGNPGSDQRHYFEFVGPRDRHAVVYSACRKYAWRGLLVLGNDASVDNCADCKRKLAARRAEEVGK